MCADYTVTDAEINAVAVSCRNKRKGKFRYIEMKTNKFSNLARYNYVYIKKYLSI